MSQDTQKKILECLSKAKRDLGVRYKIRYVALFGSYARGDQRPDSDIDVLIDVDPSVGLAFSDLAEELEQRLGGRVEVVSRRAIHPRHWQVIAPEVIDVE